MSDSHPQSFVRWDDECPNRLPMSVMVTHPVLVISTHPCVVSESHHSDHITRYKSANSTIPMPRPRPKCWSHTLAVMDNNCDHKRVSDTKNWTALVCMSDSIHPNSCGQLWDKGGLNSIRSSVRHESQISSEWFWSVARAATLSDWPLVSLCHTTRKPTEWQESMARVIRICGTDATDHREVWTRIDWNFKFNTNCCLIVKQCLTIRFEN